MKKAIVIALVLSLLLSFSVFASGEQESAGTDKAAGEKVTIRTLTRFSGTDATTPIWQLAIKEFMEKNPNIKVEDESVNQEAAYNNKLKTDMATGNLPNVFYRPGVVSLVKLAENGIIMNVDEMMKDKEWFDGFINGTFEVWNFESYGVEGHYGVPYSIAPEVMLYNTELFSNAGIGDTPATMDDLYVVIDKLKGSGVIPWACGAKSTWRAGHIHNYLLYKWAGVETAVKIGTREKKWTDPEVVQSLAYLKDLKARGAFAKNFEGMDYDMEKIQFFTEEAAMMLNGSWFVGDCINSDIHDKIDVFGFPYFKEKPQFKGHAVNFPQGFQLNGKMEGDEKEATIKFVKFFTGNYMQTKMVEQIQRMSARKDIDTSDMELSHVFKGYTEVLNSAEMLGGDSFDYDPLSSMMDRSRNSIIGMLLGNTPREAAEEIQAEIDKNM